MSLINFCLAALGYILVLVGGGLTVLILLSGFLSGSWSIGHGYPILIVSLPALIVGVSLIRFLTKTKQI
jgi:hypothetical protein